MRWLREFRSAALAGAPNIMAFLVAGAGMLLLASGATPSDPDRFMTLAESAPIILIEVAHFVSSVLGVLLVLLAFGLSRRLDGAWLASLVLLVVAAALALFKGFNWEESVALLIIAALLLPCHSAFPRRARLTRMEITPGWMLSALAIVGGAGLVGWWSFQHLDYTDVSVLKLMAGDSERAIRSSAGAAIFLLGFGVWRMLATPATPPVIDESDPDYAKVSAVLAGAEVAEPSSNLALLGDKRFLFSPSGKTFLMFGVRGRSWIALGGPVGQRDERLDLLWRFRELADAHAARPGLYGLGPDDLPDLVELGFSIQKIGETAIVPLDSFSLDGRRRGNLRRSWRKTGECGAQFEVIEAQAAACLMPQLRAVSDQWLAHHAGGDKSFSLGAFEPAYVANFPIAVVRVDGVVVAFATLWTTAKRSSFSIDLMRYADSAPKDVMDFLFVELLHWGREQDYVAFEFGMAPLAGLGDRPLAPMLSRVGRLFFERGEEIYNFRGVYRYKDKYDPRWQPCYVAAPRKWAIPMIMADVGLLTAGGVGGLGRRPKRRGS